MHARAVACALTVMWPLAALAGEVRGAARFGGAPPAAGAALETTKDRATCGDAVPDESLLVSQGGLENVLVRVEVPGVRAAPRTVVLDQQRCRYQPRAQVAPLGSTLELRNGDPILHNVHGYAGTATAFNVPMPIPGGKAPRPLSRPGVVRVACDVHAWMAASILVTETPFAAVTGKGGAFELTGVPPGTWQAVAWHERFGEKRAVVVVPEKGAAELVFTFP
ncbi:MAG TPA: TonB-dependent receptor [Anaeromyxobacteraceae bacterium]|nr:TonB-dependent receptor [Anaeromyxobacteraceae bacterium]